MKSLVDLVFGKRLGDAPTPLPPSAMPRDTDADWEQLGRNDSYFGVLADPRFRSDVIDDAARAEFFASGEAEIDHQLAIQRSRFGPFEPGSALDFGCGVGRLTRALANRTGRAVGVDVSPSMLAEARKGAHATATFRPDLPEGRFDWIVSIIVFQHIPPERGYGLLRNLLARAAPGAGLTLQLTVYRDLHHRHIAGGRLALGERIETLDTSAALAALPPGEMVMFDYDLSVVMALVFEAGFADAVLVHTDHGGFHGVFIHGRRT